jgi:hypothetical protein
MTAPDKIWINWNPAVAAQGQISTEAITVLSYISTMPYPIKYTRTDLSDAIIAALVKHIADTVATSPHMNDLAQSIRALTPPDAQAALQAMIDAAVKEARAKFSAQKHVAELIEFLQADPDNIYHLPADDLELLHAKIGGAS